MNKSEDHFNIPAPTLTQKHHRGQNHKGAFSFTLPYNFKFISEMALKYNDTMKTESDEIHKY